MKATWIAHHQKKPTPNGWLSKGTSWVQWKFQVKYHTPRTLRWNLKWQAPKLKEKGSPSTNHQFLVPCQFSRFVYNSSRNQKTSGQSPPKRWDNFWCLQHFFQVFAVPDRASEASARPKSGMFGWSETLGVPSTTHPWSTHTLGQNQLGKDSLIAYW